MIHLIAVLALLASAAAAQAQGCEDLWYRRNSIFKQAGYCFKTTRAIRTFGNAGCAYDDENDVPLSARQRQVVADLRSQEREFGCPR